MPDETLSAELMSKWEYYTLLSYIEINGKNDPKKIAQTLGTTESTVKAILENLLQLDIIKIEKNLLKVTGKILTAPPSFNSASLKKVHKEYIEKAGSFLMEGDLSTADFSGITFAVSSKKVKEAAQRIRDFRRSLGQFLSEPGSTDDSVYRINIQFFPVVPPKN
ncbi:hypothetical protein D3C87_1569110 [compost metagenome]